MAKPRCGAKTRVGGQCQAPAMPNGRCRRHGGLSTGAPKGNTNGAKPGNLYSKYLTEEERAEFDAVKLGTVEQELRLLRIRLARALAAEAAAAGQPEIESRVRRTGGGAAVAKGETTHKVRDYVGIVNSLTARIESLERTRLLLLEAAAADKRDELPEPVTEFRITVVTPQTHGPSS